VLVHVTYLDPTGSQLGHKESVADTAAVLGRMYDAIEFRGNKQADVEELAAHAGVPVYNGLTDEWHPTQMLAEDIAGRTGARITITEDPAQAVAGADFIHADVSFSMGESKDVWAERVKLLAPYQVNSALLAGSGTRPSSSCTACPPSTTRTPPWARRSWNTPA
jgi:ornithine carbamoyltransferase